MNHFRSFKIGVKMLAGYFAVAAITAVLGFISTLSLHDLLTAAQSTYTDSTEPLGSMGRIGIVVQRSRVNIRGMLLDDSVERMEANAATIRKNDSIIDQDMSHLEKSLKQDLRKDFTKLQKLLVEYRPVREKIISLALSGEREEALDLMRSDGLAFEKDIDATIGTLLDLEVKQAKENLEQNDAAAWMSIKLNILLVLIGVVAAAVIGYFLARHITGPLRKVADFAEAIASGDLTDRLNLQRKDETGQLAAAMNVMADKLRSIITLLFQQSSSVAAAADRLTSTSSAMANGTEEVSSQSMTLAAASEEMAATSNEISSNCHMVADGARKASDSATTGSTVVSNTVAGMERIASRVQASAATIIRLGENSEKIGTIIGTIQDIADQTNLLALNAAIEAARAGEQGRGFAVVADEVRALAERTARATREIGGMIQDIQRETADAVSSMEQGVAEVENGTKEAALSFSALEEIKRMVDSVAMQIAQIATAAEQQTATTSEIAGNIQSITEIMMDTSRGAHETASEAQEMTLLAEELKKVVEQFRLPA